MRLRVRFPRSLIVRSKIMFWNLQKERIDFGADENKKYVTDMSSGDILPKKRLLR